MTWLLTLPATSIQEVKDHSYKLCKLQMCPQTICVFWRDSLVHESGLVTRALIYTLENYISILEGPWAEPGTYVFNPDTSFRVSEVNHWAY